MRIFSVKEAIRDRDGELIGVVLVNNERKLMISQWDHEVLKKVNNVEVRIPKKGVTSKFINKPLSLRDNGQIIEIPSYWRMGTMLEKILITRTYRFVGLGEKRDERRTKLKMPFGSTVIADLEICLATNKKSGEKRIILNFFLRKEEGREADFEIKLGGKRSSETIEEIEVPLSGEKIYINRK